MADFDRDNMSSSRDLLDVRNLGEFAFAMAAFGLVLGLVSYVAAFFALELVGIRGRAPVVSLSVVIWLLLNIPVYSTLRQRARLWIGEQRTTRQISYVEWSSVVMLVSLSLLGRNAVGTRELIVALEYLFSFWILSLLAYQVLLHFVMRYKIFARDAVKWGIILIYTTLNLYANCS